MSFTLRQIPANENNYTPGREGKKIDKIVIHHAATTDFDGIATTFQNPNRGASAHYGVGRNNNVDQYVQESDTAWHAANWAANTTSVGIENVNLTGAPNWDIDPATFNTLVELVRDIANRNGLLPLQVGRNLFGHKDFIQTACPMTLYNRLQELADRVNNGPTLPPITPPKNNATDQILEIGSNIVFDKSYRVDDLQHIGGIWQVKTNVLCPVDFTWDDNGIPVMPLEEVSGGAGNPNDQVLQIGALYKIPGKYKVLNLGTYKGRWLAQIDMQGWKLWVDVESVTEVA